MQSEFLLSIGVGTSLVRDYEFYFWILMGASLLCIAIAKTSNQYYFGSLFTTAIINRQLLQKTQEELKLNSTSSILLTLNYFLTTALLVVYIAQGEYQVITLYIFAGLLAGTLFKWAGMWFLAHLTQNRQGIAEHGMNHLIYYQVGGLVIAPILFLSHFFPDNIYYVIVFGCLIFLVFLLLFREIQSIARALKARVAPLYIILYLCTLELMPLVLIIYAFVVNFVGLN
jgi:hypothetical protein